MSDSFNAPLAFDPAVFSTVQSEKLNADVLACEACEMVKTPDPVHMLVNFEVNRAETCARLESNVIVERTHANIKEPIAHAAGDSYRDESKG